MSGAGPGICLRRLALLQTACNRAGFSPVMPLLRYPDDSMGWHTWIWLPRAAQCQACLAEVGTPGFVEHLAITEHSQISATMHQALSVAIFCYGLADAVDDTMADLVADVCAGVHGAETVLLDLAEQRGFIPERYLPIESGLPQLRRQVAVGDLTGAPGSVV